MHPHLVSIIIPTYNRSNLIGETLDSIIAQSYKNWNCTIIDDGSDDYTTELLEFYIQKDNRFSFYKRTENYLPGGNGARNYGLNLAKGDYIIFFDSDDLMTEDHIEVKIKSLLKHKVDYVITRTRFLHGSKCDFDHYYTFEKYEITLYNYLFQKINWLTYDTLIKATLAKSILFNEKLYTGQEYNYYSKLTAKSTHCIFIDKVVTLRRKHEVSKQGGLKNDKKAEIESAILKTWFTYIDLEDKMSITIKRKVLFNILDWCYLSGKTLVPDKSIFLDRLNENFKNGALKYRLMICFKKYLGRGYFFRQKFKVQL
ncbi:glycosyltransferase family 2 protein [Zunongwangia endophytica]|uniref:Glycosyltransferase family 2 protein n=1 Tax=Zunongwangia endophytica TaxID=1808945 RepID=A0ABV8H957_9FLAO|nr:glycosyltransferase family 2 protein [Zunongwangia endophytica]MDN3595040.1 glycosyltransferase family 2 protein [Zunongwangia endophytica]